MLKNGRNMTEQSSLVIDKLCDAMKTMEKCVECTICLQHMSVPVKTRCGHTFCEACIRKVLSRKNTQCPLCNTKLNRRSISKDKHMSMYIASVEKLKKAIQDDVGPDILLRSARPINTKESHSPATAPQNSAVEMPGTSTDIPKAAANSLPKVSALRRTGRKNPIEGKSAFQPGPSKPLTNAARSRSKRKKSSTAREDRSRNSWSTLNVSRSLTRSLSPPKISPRINPPTKTACHNSPPVLTAEANRSLNASLIHSPTKLLQNPAETRKRVIASRQLFLDRANGTKRNSVEKPSSGSLKSGENLALSKVECGEGFDDHKGDNTQKIKGKVSDPAGRSVPSNKRRRPSNRKYVAKFFYKASTRPKVAAKETRILESKATQTDETNRIVRSTQTNDTPGSPMIRIPLESFELGVSPTKISRSDTVRGNESSQWPKTPPRTDSRPEPTRGHESFERLSGSTKTISGAGSTHGNDSFEGAESTKLASCPKTVCSNDSFERFASTRTGHLERSRRLESVESLESPVGAEKTLCNDSTKRRRLSTTSSDSKWSGASTVIMEIEELPKKDYRRLTVIPGTESDSSDGPGYVKSTHISILSRSKNAAANKRKRSSSEEDDRVNDIVSHWCRNSGSTQCSNKKTRPCSVLSRKSNVLPDKPRALAALSDESTNVDDIITDWCRDAGPIRKFIGNDKSNSVARNSSPSLFKGKLSNDVNAPKTSTLSRDKSFAKNEAREACAKAENGRPLFIRKSSDEADASTMDDLCTTQISVNVSRSEDTRAKHTNIDPSLSPHKSPEASRDASHMNTVSTERKSISNVHSRQGNAGLSLNPHKSSDRIPRETSHPTNSTRTVQKSSKKNKLNDIRDESENTDSSLNSRKTSSNATKPSIRSIGRCISTMDSVCTTQDPLSKMKSASVDKNNGISENTGLRKLSSSYRFTSASKLATLQDTSMAEDLFDSPGIEFGRDAPNGLDHVANVVQDDLQVAKYHFNDDIIDRVRELQRSDVSPKNSETFVTTSNPPLEDNFDEVIANVDSADLIGDFPLLEDVVPEETTVVEPAKTLKNVDDKQHLGTDDLDLLVVSLGGSCGSGVQSNHAENNSINPKTNQRPVSSEKPDKKKIQEGGDRKGIDTGSSLRKQGSNKDVNHDNHDSEDSLMNVTQHQMLIKAFEEDLFGGLPWSPVKTSTETTALPKDGNEQPEQRTPQHKKKDIKKANLNNKDTEHSVGEDDIVESTPETKVKNSRSSSRSGTPTPVKKCINMPQKSPLSKQVRRIASNTMIGSSAMKPLQHSTPKVLPKVQSNETPSSTASSPVLRTNCSRLESTSSRRTRNVRRKVSMVCSGLTPQQIEHVKGFARMVGGTFKSLFDENVTHVIVKTEGKSNAAQKTLKYLQGVANGKWVVGYEWIVESMAKGRLVSEEPYEVVESPNLEAGPRKSRLGQRNLFVDFALVLCGPFEDVTVKQIRDMLLFNGATVFETVADLAAEKKKLKAIVLRDDFSSVQNNVVDWSRRSRAVLVSHVWIIECISRYRIISLYPYLLKLEPEDALAFGFPQHLVEDDEVDSD